MRMEKVHTHTLGQVKFEGVLIGKVTFFTTQSILDGNFKFTWKPYCHFASEMKRTLTVISVRNSGRIVLNTVKRNLDKQQNEIVVAGRPVRILSCPTLTAGSPLATIICLLQQRLASFQFRFV